MDALILGHYHKEPSTLEEDEYIKHFQALDYHLKVQNRLMYNSFRRALTEVVNELFSSEESA
ncbi:hypothetical protein [Ornithobacterium rhinotracheale]|uniref:hypothetical protein n=1 Tax=Ornithobacterium rhinotracheale TaxID=28251 RepID=UPI0002D8B48D|nr:hypothetical protein [Ornithobacterium rhinotracheale]AIQ00738.1 hypothetical protein Q785_11355 [Ornithobacterium rhinotracheale ORT-UMN 88]KGB65822.1 hypothetical protein Q787_10880 [Ornithobacterium rhinotracheale H06-030791]MBN3662818.1 hypothetical protein [Ornithobacterium rhinotracheale]MCK0193278.1 hypothetical protein [Ornithobacterium rhinotracheale]MCK0201149.1 hypothetical protein [Ornithobacterium rhinotracheale]